MTFEELKFRPRPGRSGIQARYVFPNGYGVSVIRGLGSYGNERGLYELAVCVGPNQHLCYDTPITDDVLGYLTEDDVTRLLGEVEALPPSVS